MNQLKKWTRLIVVVLISIPVLSTGVLPGQDRVNKVFVAVQPMDRLVTVNLQGDLTLQMVVAAIGESVGLSIAFDKRGMMEVVGDIDSLKVSAPTGRRKALDHLERLLKPEGLVAVPLSTGWTITSEDRAFALQMRQKIDVAWVSKPLDELVAQMSELHRINVVIDPRQASAGKKLVNFSLKGATLEATIRLGAEITGLKPVTVGNVVFLTSMENARSLAADPELVRPHPDGVPSLPNFPDLPRGLPPVGPILMPGPAVPPPPPLPPPGPFTRG